jgi:hypothetical protein
VPDCKFWREESCVTCLAYQCKHCKFTMCASCKDIKSCLCDALDFSGKFTFSVDISPDLFESITYWTFSRNNKDWQIAPFNISNDFSFYKKDLKKLLTISEESRSYITGTVHFYTRDYSITIILNTQKNIARLVSICNRTGTCTEKEL